MSGFAQHKLAELLSLNLPINLVGKLADVLGEHRLLHELLAVVLFNVAEFSLVGNFSVVDDRLDIVLEFLHYIFVLQGSNIHIFSLNVGIKEGALLRRVAVLESFIPTKTLEFQIEVKYEKRVCEVDISIAPIVSSLKIHREVKVVKSF